MSLFVLAGDYTHSSSYNNVLNSHVDLVVIVDLGLRIVLNLLFALIAGNDRRFLKTIRCVLNSVDIISNEGINSILKTIKLLDSRFAIIDINFANRISLDLPFPDTLTMIEMQEGARKLLRLNFLVPF